MSVEYERVPEPGDGLRLHLNENTYGCSPAVLAAIRALDATRMAFYPAYEEATARCARHLGVRADQVLLTNGLDEGIMAACVAAARERAAAPESIIVDPAFDMYAACTDAAGGRIVRVPPAPDFEFPLEAVLASITSETALVFLTTPNNPTGRPIDLDAIDRIARAAADATVFVDEAYVEFGGSSTLGRLDDRPNLLVGRTFAKAYGLAALRVGALVGRPDRLAPLRRTVPPYNLNVCAAVALPAALDDEAHVRRYVSEVERSRQLLYAACERHGLPYWRSAANFVLIKVGDRAGDVVAGLAERGIFVRDRSHEPGCEGCIRITAGVEHHTQACVDALESLL